MRHEPRRTSPWVWIAAGCGGCLVLGVAATVAIGWWGYQFTQELVEDLENPQSREVKVLEILGAEKLPEGYYPALGLSIPWVVDLAMLSGKPVEYERQGEDSLDLDLGEDDFGDRAFIYISSRTFKNPEKEVERFFTNRAGRAMSVHVQGIGVRAGELLRQGEIEVRGVPVRYRIDRGALELERSEQHLGRGATAGEPEGLLIRVHFRCADAGRLRLGMWHGPAAEGALDEPGPVEAPPSQESVAAPPPSEGLPTDEAALRDFLAHFDACGEQGR